MYGIHQEPTLCQSYKAARLERKEKSEYLSSIMADQEIAEKPEEAVVDIHESSYIKQQDDHLTNTHVEFDGGIDEVANDEGDETPKTFPQRLMDMLSDESHSDIISWCPHGNAFVIHKKKVFASDVLPKYFKATKFTSFTRKLNRWGFNRISRGPETGSYYHKLFRRDKPELCLQMTSNSGNKYHTTPMQPQLLPNIPMMMPGMPHPMFAYMPPPQMMGNVSPEQQQAMWHQHMQHMNMMHMQQMSMMAMQQQQQRHMLHGDSGHSGPVESGHMDNSSGKTGESRDDDIGGEHDEPNLPGTPSSIVPHQELV